MRSAPSSLREIVRLDYNIYSTIWQLVRSDAQVCLWCETFKCARKSMPVHFDNLLNKQQIVHSSHQTIQFLLWGWSLSLQLLDFPRFPCLLPPLGLYAKSFFRWLSAEGREGRKEGHASFSFWKWDVAKHCLNMSLTWTLLVITPLVRHLLAKITSSYFFVCFYLIESSGHYLWCIF